jgi:hypothetical protein
MTRILFKWIVFRFVVFRTSQFMQIIRKGIILVHLFLKTKSFHLAADHEKLIKVRQRICPER